MELADEQAVVLFRATALILCLWVLRNVSFRVGMFPLILTVLIRDYLQSLFRTARIRGTSQML